MVSVKTLCLVLMFILIPILEETEASPADGSRGLGPPRGEAAKRRFYCPDGSTFLSKPEDVWTNYDRNCQCDCCPYNKRWECSIPESISDPFANLANVPGTTWSGSSTPIDISGIKDAFEGDGFFQFNMKFACKAHDYCYATYGRSQEECDDEFHTNMLRVCSTNFFRDFGSLGFLSCPAVSGYAYAAVRGQVQDMESKWDTCPEDCKCARTFQQRLEKCMEPLTRPSQEPNGGNAVLHAVCVANLLIENIN